MEVLQTLATSAWQFAMLKTRFDACDGTAL
jgi:hypothetical protein